jgi:hypothetical protein
MTPSLFLSIIRGISEARNFLPVFGVAKKRFASSFFKPSLSLHALLF